LRRAAALAALITALSCDTVVRAGEITYGAVSQRVVRDPLGRETTVEFRQRVHARPEALRTENLGSGKVTIVLLGERRMIELDPKEKTFRTISFDRLRRSVDAHLKLLEARLRDRRRRLSRSQRSRILGILGRRRVRVQVDRSKETVELLGRACTKVTYREDGIIRIEEWVTEEVERCVDLTPLLEITGEFSKELLAAKRRQKGFALKSVVHGRLAISPLRTTNTVESLDVKPLDDALFKVPEGYRDLDAEPPDEGGGGEGPAPGPAEPEPGLDG